MLDTNVLAAAAVTRGLCADVLRNVLVEHDLLLCGQIVTELHRVLRSKFGIPEDEAQEFLSMLKQDAAIPGTGAPPAVRLKDKADLVILAAAVAGAADALVTGEKELLELGRIGSVKILSPRRFWETVRSDRGKGTGAVE